jgi:hypothetical protein
MLQTCTALYCTFEEGLKSAQASKARSGWNFARKNKDKNEEKP